MTVQATVPASFVPAVGPAAILPYAAARYGDKPALVIGDRRFSYNDLERSSRRVAVGLRRRGIGAGDVVSLYGQNSWQWIVSYHGALRAGAVVNPVNVMLTAPELAYVLDDCRSRALFVGTAQAATGSVAASSVSSIQLLVEFGETATVEGATTLGAFTDGAEAVHVEPDLLPSDLCAIAYTSGTTGHPKGAMQSHRSILLNCALTATMHGRGPTDVVVTALPAAHVYGNVAINSTFLAGGTVVLMERFDAAAALRLLATERATMFEGVPAMYSMLLAEPGLADTDLTGLRVCTVGGQTIAAGTIDRWQRRSSAPLIELWGMTELAGLGTTHSHFAPPVPGSIGVALPGVEVRVCAVDDGDVETGVGEPGELQVRGPLVMLGYFGNPAATTEALGPDGWLRTGDVAYRDDTGHFFVVDRLKDMIVTAGYNVYPAEIERVVSTHPDVAVVAVGRRPDPVRGEIAVAYVVARPGAAPTAADILEHCRSRLAAYKRPRDVVFVEQLPTTSSGKIMRRKLAELEPDGRTAAVPERG